MNRFDWLPRSLAGVMLMAVAASSGAGSAQAPTAPRSMPAAAALRDDLAQFRREFMAVERSYSSAARAQAEDRLAALEAAVDSRTLAQFEIDIARIVALADNGHTNVAAPGRARRHNRVHVRLVPFGSDFHVVRARGEDQDLLGARLVAIDGKPVAQARDLAHGLTGGTAEFRDRVAPLFFESPELLHAAGIGAGPAAVTYSFELADGRRVERRLTGAPPDPGAPSMTPGQALYPDPGVGEAEGWRGLLAVSAAPWALQDVSTKFRWRDAPEIDAVVVELRQNRSTPGHDIERFLEEIGRKLRSRPPRNVVLDLRMNGGGDLNTTRAFMRGLPALVPGRVFALTSAWTFSAAISSIGYLEQAAPDRVILVGEMVGDRLEFWAEGRPLTLSHSGIVISRATERHDYATGCKPYTDCHGSVVRNPIAVRSLTPDIPAPWTIDAYRAGRDPAMEAVVRALK